MTHRRRGGAAREACRLLACLAVAIAALGGAPAGVPAARPRQTTLVVPPDRHTLGIHRATDIHLKLFTGIGNRFRGPEGLACTKLIALDDPRSARDDDELTVYGVNSGDPSIIYNDSMTSVRIWRGAMRAPRGIAADASGRVVVADTGNDRLLLLRNVAGKLALERTVGRRGAGPGEFAAPSGVALDSRGRIYVADTGNHRVQVLDPLGKPLSSFGAPGVERGRLTAPTAIAVVDRANPWAFRRRDLVFVVDRGGRRIQSFSPSGALVAALDGEARGERTFAYIALDYYDNVYATDPRRSQIHKLDESLRPIADFGRRGTGDAEFIGPTGIAIWRRFGQVFVAESTGAQYYWIGTDIEDLFALPETLAAGGEGEIAITLTEHSEVDVEIRGASGEVVRSPAHGAFHTPGPHRIAWAACDAAGAPLAPGRYRIRVSARPTYSSKKHFRRESECAVLVIPRGARDAPRRESP